MAQICEVDTFDPYHYPLCIPAMKSFELPLDLLLMVFFVSISHREDQFETLLYPRFTCSYPCLCKVPHVRPPLLEICPHFFSGMCQALVANGSIHGMICFFLQSLSHSCFEVHLLYLYHGYDVATMPRLERPLQGS